MLKIIIQSTVLILATISLATISCQKELSCYECEINKPPIANAGNDTSIILPTDSIILDGSKSSDPDDDITSYKWRKISGPETIHIGNEAAVITTASKLIKGSYRFELTVTDKGGLVAKDTMQATVNPVAVRNHPPIANAGRDTTIMLPVNSVMLDGGKSSDPDNNIVSYAWKKVSGPASIQFSNANAVHTQLTNLQLGIYLVELTVTDAGGLFSKDTVRVVVNNSGSNLPPVAIAGPDQDKTLSTCSVVLDGSSSYDPDGAIVSAKWTMISGVAVMGIADPDSLVTALLGFSSGIYVFRLQVTDNNGLTDADTIQIKTTNVLVGKEIIYDGVWGCNDVCADGDVYWVDGDYCDPNTELAVIIRLDTSSSWIEVRKEGSPLPSINQFYRHIDRGYLWVFAYEGRLIRTKVTIKVKYL
jgi:PKD repeat protein